MVYTAREFGGLTTGGDTVYVRGYFFGKTQPPTATVDGVPVTFSSWSDNILTFRSPPHAEGKVEVTVPTPHGTSAPSLHSTYTYFPPAVPKVTSMTPAYGPWAGGTIVTVRGSGFTGTSKATLGGMTVNGFSVLTDSTRSSRHRPARPALRRWRCSD